MDADVRKRLDQLAYEIAKLRARPASSVTLPIAESDVTNLVTDLATLTATTSQNGCLVRRTTNQVNAGVASITWEAADYNDGTIWSGGDPTKLTIKKAGRYLMGGLIVIDDGGAGGATGVRVNGTDVIALQGVKGTSAAGDTFPYITIFCGPLVLAVSDVVTVPTAAINGAGGHTVKASALGYPFFSVTRML